MDDADKSGSDTPGWRSDGLRPWHGEGTDRTIADYISAVACYRRPLGSMKLDHVIATVFDV